MDRVSLALGIAAACIHVTAYALYNIQSKKGQSKPNAATWGIWAFLVVLNAMTYREVSHSILVALPYYTSSISCLLTFCYLLVTGKYDWPEWRDWVYAGLAAIGGVIWLVFHHAGYANLVITGAILLSFEPTYKTVWRNPHKEKPGPWVLWALAFIVITANVAHQRRGFMAFVSPVSLCLAHYAVAMLCSRRRKENFDACRAEILPAPR